MSLLHRQHQITFIAFLPPGTSYPRSSEALDAVSSARASALGPSAKPPVQWRFFGLSSWALPNDFLALYQKSQLGRPRLPYHVQDHLGIETALVGRRGR